MAEHWQPVKEEIVRNEEEIIVFPTFSTEKEDDEMHCR